MRGQGLELNKYAWCQQPNGRYTIFNVPIFSLFADKARGVVAIEDVQEIISNFQLSASNGNFPRIMIGHHEDGSLENKPGAGYLDNIRFCESDSTFYADFVELYPEVFQEIRNLKYPERSPEYHPGKKIIKRLALLESQPGYFEFPVLSLQDSPISCSPEQLQLFSDREN